MSETPLKDEIKPYFPYDKLRRMQGRAINIIHEEIKMGKHVVVNAPNGFGKTIMALSSILPLIRQKNKKLIYLCRTHVQIQRVIEELSKIIEGIKKKGLQIDIGGIGLRGRQAMCFHPTIIKLADPNSAHLACRELRNTNRCSYYNNINRKSEQVDFLLSILQITPMGGSQLIETCRDYDLCPYIISKQALAQVDVIACNYQWILSPYIRKGFLETLDTNLKDIILIIDEAHNLPNISTEILSTSLSRFGIERFINESKQFNKKYYVKFGKTIQEIFNELAKKDFDEIAIIPEYIIKKIISSCNIKKSLEFFRNMIETGKQIRNQKIKLQQPPQSSIFTVGNFWLKWIKCINKDNYFFCATKNKTKRQIEFVKLEIVALDPSELLKEIFNSVEGSLHMSGTITPEAYIDTIGLSESSMKLSLPSLWKDENLKVLALKGITSRGASRSLEMYRKMVVLISEAIEYTPKNVAIFTASYDVLNGLLKAGFKKIQTNKKIFTERPDNTSEQNDLMIKQFKEESKKKYGGVLLGVCGGRNAEGEDFPGDFMNTVIVCGVPFSRPTARVQALINYNVKNWGTEKGKDIAYNIPALRRANQAGGRPIRTLNDSGVIILMDYRYATRHFNRFLTKWLRDKIKVLENRPGEIKKELQSFYRIK